MNGNTTTSGALILLLASVLLTWLFDRRRNRRADKTAETSAEAATITAITGATGDLADAVSALVHPLLERIEALEAAEKELRLALSRHEKIVNSFIAYTGTLRIQLTDNEIVPHPLPAALEGFQFD